MFQINLFSTELQPAATTVPSRPVANALHLAEIWEGPSGPIGALLRRGMASSYGEALAQLLPRQRAALRQVLGSEYETALGLARETNPELFAEGLLAMGQRLERADREELACRLYQHLQENDPASGRLAGRARQRQNLFTGEGPLLAQLPRLFDHLVRGVCSPELVGGMIAGGLGLGLGRYGGLRLFRALGARGPWLRGLGQLSGFAMETNAFLGASLGIGFLRGHPLPNDVSGWAREWGSAALMLGMLRAGELMSRGLSHPGLVRAIQPVGSFAGLLGDHYLKVELGWTEPRPFGDTLIHSAATLLTFHLGARIAHGLTGPRLQRLQNQLHWESHRISTPPPPAIHRPLAFGAMAPVGAAEGQMGRSSAESLMVYHMGGEGEGGGRKPGSGRRRDMTMPFVLERARVGKDPRRVASSLELMRRIQDADLGFIEQLREADVTFTLTGPFAAERSVPRIVELLNTVTQPYRGSGVDLSIPEGRKIQLRLEAPDGTLHRSIEIVLTGRWIAPDFAEPNVAREPGQDMSWDFDLPATTPNEPPVLPESQRPATPERVIAARQATEIHLEGMPLLTNDLVTLPARLTEAMERAAGEKVPPVIVEGRSLNLNEINAATDWMFANLPEGVDFRIMVPENPLETRTFYGQVMNQELRWRSEGALEWELMEGQANFSQTSVPSAWQVYQLIFAWGRGNGREAQMVNQIRLRGRYTHQYREELATLIEQALNTYQVTGQKILVNFEGGVPSLEFINREGRWTLEG